MDESILTDLFAALDIAAMERLDDCSFIMIGAVPDWFARLYPNAALGRNGLMTGKEFSFLENFLIDAECFWTGNNSGLLKSELWIETDPSGKEYGLEASAVVLKNGKILLLKSLGIDYEEKQSIIQKARENNLDYHRLVQLERELLKSRAKNRALLNAIPDLMFRIGRDGVYLDFIPAKGFETLAAPGEFIGKKVHEVLPAELAGAVMNHVAQALSSGNIQVFEYQLPMDDNERDFEARIVVSGEDEVLAIVRDITKRKRMEKEFIKAQKLESIGILAGGIAHDFNNLLTAILGNVSLVKTFVSPEDKMYKRLVEAEKACLRAKGLTGQLLTFSKGGALVKRVTSIEELIKDSTGFALIGSKVRCEFSIPEGTWPVEVDEGQMSQAINNLVINAEQAMPEGGIIRVSVENTDKIRELGTGLKPAPAAIGKYVKITIEDCGAGIPENHIPKIFDPYFTTKQKGSGLGLTTAYSVIKNHDGYIGVESDLGVGTKFYIYIPATEEKTPEEKTLEERFVEGRGRVLVMDDEEIIREVAGEMLSRSGYDVEFATDGGEAIELYKRAKENGKPFDVVIMDLTIPGGMGGKETIDRLIKIDPGVRAVASSGYSNDSVMSEYERYGFRGVIAKPYKIEELSATLRKVVKEK